MSLIKTASVTEGRAIVEVTILGRTTRLTTDWVPDWQLKGQYGPEERLREDARMLVKKFEHQWGPVAAEVVTKNEWRTTTTQTYQATTARITSTQAAGTKS